MTTLRITFPGRRYHATPWGHHVNEGLVEWPPSPWRLLRALLSVGFTACGWREVPGRARELFEQLAPILPRYRLPSAAAAHTRHFMPAPVKRTLVLDTWAQMDGGELLVHWPVELRAGPREILGELAGRVNYLGRSESWVEASLVEGEAGCDPNCTPEEQAPGFEAGWDQVALLAPMDPLRYSRWREESLSRAGGDPKQESPASRRKRPTASLATAHSAYPPDLIACLLAETTFLRDHGWSRPPGSRRVLYRRPSNALEAGPPRRRVSTEPPRSVDCMLLALTSPSGNDRTLPGITRVLPQGELLHRSLVAQCDGSCPSLTGCNSEGAPLKGHGHAHLLHLDLDGDGHIEHCLIWAPGGLDDRAQSAVRAVRRTFTKGGLLPLRLAVAGLGGREEMRALGGRLGEAMQKVLGNPGGSRIWRSMTPFVAPRYLKKRGKNTLSGQVEAELASRNLATARVETLNPRDARFLRFRHFVTSRIRGSAPKSTRAYSLELTFKEPVEGPLALGYGSHFGLGLFQAVDLE